MYEVFEHLLQSHYKRFAPKLPLKKNKKMQKPLDYWCPMCYIIITERKTKIHTGGQRNDIKRLDERTLF